MSCDIVDTVTSEMEFYNSKSGKQLFITRSIHKIFITNITTSSYP